MKGKIDLEASVDENDETSHWSGAGRDWKSCIGEERRERVEVDAIVLYVMLFSLDLRLSVGECGARVPGWLGATRAGGTGPKAASEMEETESCVFRKHSFVSRSIKPY